MYICSPFCTERRPKRFKYRHTAQAAADETGIPLIWIWYWAFRGLLRTRQWLRQTWVRLEKVQRLTADLGALEEAFLSTRAYLPDYEHSRVLRRWRWLQDLEPESGSALMGHIVQMEQIQ